MNPQCQGQTCRQTSSSSSLSGAWVVLAGCLWAVCGLSGSGVNAPYAEHPLCLLRASLDQVARNDPLIEDIQN